MNKDKNKGFIESDSLKVNRDISEVEYILTLLNANSSESQGTTPFVLPDFRAMTLQKLSEITQASQDFTEYLDKQDQIFANQVMADFTNSVEHQCVFTDPGFGADCWCRVDGCANTKPRF